MRKSSDYDSTFKTMKHAHKRLFISLINEAFGKNYPLSSDIIDVLPSEGILLSGNPDSSEKKTVERDNDFLICIGGDYYLVESQVYDDDTMALRIAEYTFLAARQYAKVTQEEVTLKIPHFTVLYIKNTPRTPRTTTVRYLFPNGEEVTCTEKNLFLSDYSKEEIIDKKLYSLIPFYIARYEKELSQMKDFEKALSDLAFLRDKMLELVEAKEISASEFVNLRDACVRVASHITDGNEIQEKVVTAVGGEIYETEWERFEREELNPLKEQLASKDEQLASMDEQLAIRAEQLASKDSEIEQLKQQLAALQSQ